MEPLRGLAWLLLLQLLGEVLARAFSLPLPGPVIGMLLLMPALGWRPLREPVTEVARFLLAHLSLLFVPVGVGVITHLGVLQQHGFRLLAVIALSTWIGLAVSALTLRALMRGRAHAAEAPDA
ncbi:CidA/LrgA family protein [Ottowia sp.]|uniref:CidA/LrgA family protein n=1 Tax=Ottowia sp. TaxID=1898956 RepID=UPI002C757C50|nr:CidA/LrgA family protein [Ottowia sp.]HOB67733.1 CidA/LrgA family protein [Ottowia sp.]HPZ55774.1 CidA/LrgA family protein [Ottowia sp.]HQD46391.1 CidA/LrgA family protein [Ottowia sp.]